MVSHGDRGQTGKFLGPHVIVARQENFWAPMVLKPDRTVLGHGENHFLNKDG